MPENKIKTERKTSSEEIKEFVGDAVDMLDGALKITPEITKERNKYAYELYVDKNRKNLKKGKINFSREKKKTYMAGSAFDYLYEVDELSPGNDCEFVTPKSSFGNALLKKVFSDYSFLTHIVPSKDIRSFDIRFPVPPEGTEIVYDREIMSDESLSKSDVRLEFHLFLECTTKKHGTEVYLETVVCDMDGEPLPESLQRAYDREREFIMSRTTDEGDGEDVPEKASAIFSEEGKDIEKVWDNVIEHWRRSIPKRTKTEFGRYLNRLELEFSIEKGIKTSREEIERIAALYRPEVKVSLLNLYYLQIPCSIIPCRIVEKSNRDNVIASFDLRVSKRDGSSSYVCGICDKIHSVNSGDEEIYICAESGQVMGYNCAKNECAVCGSISHEGLEHAYWNSECDLPIDPFGCGNCGVTGYICSHCLHPCDEPGCKEVLCDECVNTGYAVKAQKDGGDVYFCAQHAGECPECGAIIRGDQLITCSCGKVYCNECGELPVVTCDCCGKKICGADDCHMNYETDSQGNRTGRIFCDSCATVCSCGSLTSVKDIITCAVCGEKHWCQSCFDAKGTFFKTEKENSGHYDFPGIRRAKRSDIKAATGGKFFCRDCLSECKGNCTLCDREYCFTILTNPVSATIADIKNGTVTGKLGFSRLFPKSDVLMKTCKGCGETYSVKFFDREKPELCKTCARIEKEIRAGDLPTPAQKTVYNENKNKINIFERLRYREKKNVVFEDECHCIIANKNSTYVIDKTTRKVKRREADARRK